MLMPPPMETLPRMPYRNEASPNSPGLPLTAIRPLNPTQWGNIDQASDGALSAVRKSNPDPAAAKAAVAALMATLTDPSKAP